MAEPTDLQQEAIRLLNEQGRAQTAMLERIEEMGSELRHMRSRMQAIETNAEAMTEAWNGNNRRLDELTRTLERMRAGLPTR